MGKRHLAGITAALILLAQVPLLACGDKLLTMARAIALYKAYKPFKKATIIVYQARSDSALKDKQFQMSLTQSGHKIKSVNPSELDKTLASGKYDLLLAEIADARSLKQRLDAQRAGTVVVPILLKPTKEELAAAEKQFGVVIKAPGGYTEHLERIDEVMKRFARPVT
jgi:hypothetical protein